MHDPALRFCAKVRKTAEETLEYSTINDAFSEYETLVATEKEAREEKNKQAKQATIASTPASNDDVEMMVPQGSGAPEPDSQAWWNEQAETLMNEYVKLVVDPGSETALMNMIKAMACNLPFAFATSVVHDCHHVMRCSWLTM